MRHLSSAACGDVSQAARCDRLGSLPACHKELDSRLASAKFKHKALNDGCEKCHDVHGSSQPLSLLKPATELCLGCHEPINTIAKATVSHSPVTTGKGCLNCHTPHAGDSAKLTTATPAVMCLNCHDKKIEQNGVTVAATPDIANATLHQHGELKDGRWDRRMSRRARRG